MSTARGVHYSYEQYLRTTGATFSQREFRTGEDVVLSEPPLRFAVNELYAGVELEE